MLPQSTVVGKQSRPDNDPWLFVFRDTDELDTDSKPTSDNTVSQLSGQLCHYES